MKEEYKKYLEDNVINEDNAVDIIDAQQEEIERLNNIIKEVREYIEENTKEEILEGKKYFYSPEQANDILEILKKGGK